MQEVEVRPSFIPSRRTWRVYGGWKWVRNKRANLPPLMLRVSTWRGMKNIIVMVQDGRGIGEQSFCLSHISVKLHLLMPHEYARTLAPPNLISPCGKHIESITIIYLICCVWATITAWGQLCCQERRNHQCFRLNLGSPIKVMSFSLHVDGCVRDEDSVGVGCR